MPKYGSSSSWRDGAAAGTQRRSRLLSTSACTASMTGGASGQAERSSTVFGGLEREPALEDRALRRTQPAPRRRAGPTTSRSPHAASPGGQVPPRPASSLKRSRMRSSELRRRQHARSRRRQLDRERQSVEQAHDLGDASRLPSSSIEVGPLRPCAKRTARSPPCQRQRLERRTSSPAQVSRSRLVTTKAALSARSSQRPSVASACCVDLFEVVEHDQTAAASGDRVAELRTRVVLRRAARRAPCRPRSDAVERASLGQIAEPDAARPVAEPGRP